MIVNLNRDIKGGEQAYMRTKVLPLVIFLLVLATAAHAGEFKVTRVYDGDTIQAVGHDVEIKVKLINIDAPEISHKRGQPSQPYAQKAKEHLTKLIQGKVVDVKGYGLDRYDRVLGVVYLNGKNINLEMVKEGLAEVYRGKVTRTDFKLMPYHAVEREARNLQKGIWSMGTIYVSPKVWREKGRKN